MKMSFIVNHKDVHMSGMGRQSTVSMTCFTQPTSNRKG